jgi:hypothetical protein
MCKKLSLQQNVVFPQNKPQFNDMCEINFVVSSITMYKYVVFILAYITLKLQFNIRLWHIL